MCAQVAGEKQEQAGQVSGFRARLSQLALLCEHWMLGLCPLDSTFPEGVQGVGDPPSSSGLPC